MTDLHIHTYFTLNDIRIHTYMIMRLCMYYMEEYVRT